MSPMRWQSWCRVPDRGSNARAFGRTRSASTVWSRTGRVHPRRRGRERTYQQPWGVTRYGVDITHQDADDAGGHREQRDETIEELERVTTPINIRQRLFRRT